MSSAAQGSEGALEQGDFDSEVGSEASAVGPSPPAPAAVEEEEDEEPDPVSVGLAFRRVDGGAGGAFVLH